MLGAFDLMQNNTAPQISNVTVGKLMNYLQNFHKEMNLSLGSESIRHL